MQGRTTHISENTLKGGFSMLEKLEKKKVTFKMPAIAWFMVSKGDALDFKSTGIYPRLPMVFDHFAIVNNFDVLHGINTSFEILQSYESPNVYALSVASPCMPSI
jgi:hypothetical protein